MIIWFINRSKCTKYVTVLERIRTYPFAIRFAIYEFNISNNITRHASCTKCAAFAVFPRRIPNREWSHFKRLYLEYPFNFTWVTVHTSSCSRAKYTFVFPSSYTSYRVDVNISSLPRGPIDVPPRKFFARSQETLDIFLHWLEKDCPRRYVGPEPIGTKVSTGKIQRGRGGGGAGARGCNPFAVRMKKKRGSEGGRKGDDDDAGGCGGGCVGGRGSSGIRIQYSS